VFSGWKSVLLVTWCSEHKLPAAAGPSRPAGGVLPAPPRNIANEEIEPSYSPTVGS
jgi:hypothetical protein